MRTSIKSAATALAAILGLGFGPRLAAQSDAPKGPQFEVASVRVADPALHATSLTGGPGSNDPGRIRYTCVPMVYLLTQAYGVAPDQISGPGWIHDVSGPDVYEISATMAPGTTKEQFQIMLQNLLTERFHVIVHSETRKFPGYILTVAKGGPKLRESTTDPNYVTPARLGADFNKDGTLKLPARRGVTVLNGDGAVHAGYREVSIGRLVSDLGFMINRSIGADTTASSLPRVIDRTGLTGIYDFTLDYECVVCQGSAGKLAGTEPSIAQATFPGIFTALEKQLGLKLEKTHDLPSEVIVIDQLEKIPTPN